MRDDAGEDRDISERESYLRKKVWRCKRDFAVLITAYCEICPMPLSMKDDKCEETLAGLRGLKSF